MLKISKERIVSKILEKTGVQEEEIEEKIQRKLKELSGLISEEGAAHIIANEYGVPIFEPQSQEPIKLAEIVPGMRKGQIYAKVVQLFPITTFTRNGSEGKVHAFVLADETARMRCAAWHAMTDTTKELKEGDIVHLKGVSARNNQGRIELSLNEQGELHLNPEGITIKNVAQMQSINAPIQFIDKLDKDSGFATILGTTVQMFPPTFYVPRNKREPNKEYTDDEKTDCVGNIVVDDGTSTMRVALFNEQLAEFLNTTKTQLKNQENWDAIKAHAVGAMTTVSGRVIHNEQFERIEIIANNAKIVNAQESKELLQQLKNRS